MCLQTMTVIILVNQCILLEIINKARAILYNIIFHPKDIYFLVLI